MRGARLFVNSVGEIKDTCPYKVLCNCCVVAYAVVLLCMLSCLAYVSYTLRVCCLLHVCLYGMLLASCIIAYMSYV